MKWILRILGIILIALVVLVGGLQVASETGEIVVLTTTDENGAPAETRLWVVELDGYQYLRSGDPGSGWYNRLLANPKVEVVRNGQKASYNAVPAPELQTQVNDLMQEKYGLSDAYISAVLGRGDAIPIRLEPVGE